MAMLYLIYLHVSKDASTAFAGLVLFLMVLTLGFVSEWQKGALDYNTKLWQNKYIQL